MADPRHPKTFRTYAMNFDELPAESGPLRMRVPRQLGHKSVKFVTHVTLTEGMKKFGEGLVLESSESGYACCAGI